MRRGVVPATLFLLALAMSAADPGLRAVVPELLSQPFYESPVRGDPDDLLLIPGSAFDASAPVQVYYQRLTNTNFLPAPPPATPSPTTNFLRGWGDVVRVHEGGDLLTVHLPRVISQDVSYGLWVRNGAGTTWSAAIKINDARPLWITPEIAFFSSMPGGLPRQLKVVGRNLRPAPLQVTRVRLTGPATHTIDTTFDPVLGDHVAVAALPETLAAGTYQVTVSRDGTSWVGLPTLQGQVQTLTVTADPTAPPQFSPQGCSPDDGQNDAPCIHDAIAAAKAAAGSTGRATVVLGAGQWDLLIPPSYGLQTLGGLNTTGIIVWDGVNLEGQGDTATIVRLGSGWVHSTVNAFTLLGRNEVRGIRFDVDPYAAPCLDPINCPFQVAERKYLRIGMLGLDCCDANASCCEPCGTCESPCSCTYGQTCEPVVCPEVIADVTITANTFTTNTSTGMVHAIGDGDATTRIDHLFITDNTIQGLFIGLAFGSVLVEDSVIAVNEFLASSYDPDCMDPHQANIATAVGESLRLDMSENEVDGTLNGGWRAGFFWHLDGSHQAMLVSNNTMTCTGDKQGDGEALSFDHNGGMSAWDPHVAPLTGTCTTTTVTVAAQKSGAMTNPSCYGYPGPSFPLGYWLQIVKGKGRGQTRRITGLSGSPGAYVVTVDPPWDIVPDCSTGPDRSMVTGAEQYWQLEIVGNTVDIRDCQKDNRRSDKSGGIWLVGATVDSVVAGNTQYESNGIELGTADGATSPAFQFFTEVRGNTVDNEYDFDGCWTHGLAPCGCAIPDEPDCWEDDSCTRCVAVDGCPCECANDPDDPDAHPECLGVAPPDPDPEEPNDPPGCTGSDVPGDANCCSGSWSGVQILYATGLGCVDDPDGIDDCTCEPEVTSEDPVGSFGVSLARNTVRHADALRSGGVAVVRGGGPGDNPRWVVGTAIHHNQVSDIMRLQPSAGSCVCKPAVQETEVFTLRHDGGVGVFVQQGEIGGQPMNGPWETTLFGNVLEEVCYPFVGGDALATLVWEPGSAPTSCPEEVQCGPVAGECPDASETGCTLSATGLTACTYAFDPGTGSLTHRLTCPPGESIKVKSCPCPEGPNEQHVVCAP